MNAMDWTDPQVIGYPALFGAVLLGSVVPLVPTGAVVGGAAAVATTTDQLNLVLVLLLAAAGALVGDLLTFAAGRGGAGLLSRWFARRQSERRLEDARDLFTRRGWLILVVGRLTPAGRMPVLLAAGALEYPWRWLTPVATAACLLWAGVYAALGVVSGGLFDDPIVATLIATVLVLVFTVVIALVGRHRERGRETVAGKRR